jgi:hypothetical protein
MEGTVNAALELQRSRLSMEMARVVSFIQRKPPQHDERILYT